MLREAAGLRALTTPYTCLWHPLFAPGIDAGTLAKIGHAFGRFLGFQAVTRLDALDGQSAWLDPFLRGARRAGLAGLRYDHFGNWHLGVAGLDWAAYLAARPGLLRSAIIRPSKRLMDRLGARFSLTLGPDGLEPAIDAYETVYARSWKQPEPCPDFNAALMREYAGAGQLRLGVLWLDGAPIAAQYWIVRQGWASIQKLSYDEAHKSLGAGTVLTALMLRHLLEVDQVAEIDFGRGDDDYKKLWMPRRRQRVGVILANMLTPQGAVTIARHLAGRARQYLRANPPGRVHPDEPATAS
jgi:hypothetical protein